jgi:hypothetical protein
MEAQLVPVVRGRWWIAIDTDNKLHFRVIFEERQ